MNRITILLFLMAPVAFAAPEAISADTALAACKSIVDLTVKKDFAGVQKLTTGMPSHIKGKTSQAGFNKMHEENWSELKKLNCNSEVVAEDHAMVQASSDKGTRLIPFVKTDAGWKFDAHTYMTFYPPQKGGKGKM